MACREFAAARRLGPPLRGMTAPFSGITPGGTPSAMPAHSRTHFRPRALDSVRGTERYSEHPPGPAGDRLHRGRWMGVVGWGVSSMRSMPPNVIARRGASSRLKVRPPPNPRRPPPLRSNS